MRNLTISYTNVCEEFTGCGVGWGGCEISFCVGERGRGLGLFRDRVKVTSMSTYNYV